MNTPSPRSSWSSSPAHRESGCSRLCPVCGSQHSRFFINAPPHLLDDLGRIPSVDYPYLRCEDCECVFIADLPTPETLSTYYDSDGFHRHKRKLTGAKADRLTLIWYAYLSVLRPIPVKPPGRHVDFGCGPGDYLVFAKSQKWESVGVEFSDGSAAEARARGLTVFTEAQLHEIPDRSIDLVTMNHSLEHVFRPLDTMRSLAAKVRPGGLVYVEVPTIESPDFWVFRGSAIGAPLHVQCFNDRNMKLLGERAGLRLEEMRNNPWMVQYLTVSFFTWLSSRHGIRVKGSTAGLISAATFLLMVVPSLLLPLVGVKGLARRYYFRKPRDAVR